MLDALEVLTPREREVIEKRFGLNNSYEMTLEEVGQILHITRERVRQIEKKAKIKLLKRWYKNKYISKQVFDETIKDLLPNE